MKIEKSTLWTLIAVGVIILIAVLAVITQGFRINPFTGKGLSVSSGFSTLSLSQVSTTSNDPNLAGTVWLLTVSQNGAGQSAYVSQSTTLTNDQTGATTNPMTISISLDKNNAVYPIVNQGVPIKTVSFTTVKDVLGGPSYACPSQYNNYYAPGVFIPYVTTVYCYNFNTVGYYGTLGAATNNFQSTINVQGSGGSDSCTISNTGATSCYSKYGNIYASWVGSLVSGQQLPSPSGQGIIAVYDTSRGGWETASSVDYNSWSSYDQNGLTNCLSQQSSTGTGGTTCFNTYNGYESSLLSGADFKSSGGNVATSSGGQYNGQINLNLGSNQFNFPVITMRIKAALVGINIPVGQPKITYASAPEFQTGQTGNIAVQVQNVGKGTGDFSVSASCTGGFQQQGTSQTISGLASQNSETVNIPITANVVSGTSRGSCTITAIDVNDPTQKSTYTVSVSASAITICSAGQEKFVGQDIQKCENNAWVTIQTCSSSQHPDYVNGKLECVANKTTGTGGIGIFTAIKDWLKMLMSGVFNLFTILKWIAVILGAIIALLFSKEFISKVAKTIPSAVVWIVSAAVGILIGILIYEIIWIALAVLIGYIIFKAVVK